MTPPNDFLPEEQKNHMLVDHLQRLYATRARDEHALHEMGARLASSPGPAHHTRVSAPGRHGNHREPAVAPLRLLAATLAMLLLTGSFVALLLLLHHSSLVGATPAQGTRTSALSAPSAATTPCTQTYQVSGPITGVVLGHGMLGGAVIVGTVRVRGPQGQAQGALGETFSVHLLQGIRMFEQHLHGCQVTALTSLKVGQQIRIQFDGSILQSEPPQLAAYQVVIVA